MAEIPTITISGTAYRVVTQLADTPNHRSFRVESEGQSYFLKVFRKEAAVEFDKQIAALAKVKADHGLLLPIESGEYNDERFVLRDWVDGDSFDHFAGKFKFNPKHLDEALAIGEQLARTVASLHSQGVAHGSLKNDNVFFDRDGEVVVTDPQGTGDPRDDVRQIGLLLCRLYTRKPTLAINSRTLMELSKAKVPMNLLKVLWQAIQDQPSQRFKDASTLATALKEVPLKDHEKTVHVRALPHAHGVKDGADPRLKWGLAVVILIAAMGAGVYWLRDATPRSETEQVIQPNQVAPERSVVFVPDPFERRNSLVTLETSAGVIIAEIYEDKVPSLSAHFLGLVDEGFYADMIFHRVVEDFMIQTGDPTGTGRGGPGRRAPDEFHPDLKFNRIGLLGLSNTGVPNSGGSQFFITVRQSAEFLDGKNPIFGEVVLGQRVADAISQVSVDAGNRPTNPVSLRAIRRMEHPGWDNVGITLAPQPGQAQYRFFVPAWNRPPAMDGWLLDPSNPDTVQADPGVVNVLSDGAGQRTIAMTIAGFYPQAELRGTGLQNASWQRGLSLVFDQSRETIRLPHPLNDGTWTPHSFFSPRGVHLDQLTRSGSWKSVREGFFVSGPASATQGFANRLTLPVVKNTADEVAIWYHVVPNRDSVASIDLPSGLVQEIDRGGNVVTTRVMGSDASTEEQFLLPRGFTQSGAVVLVIFSADSARILVNGQPAHEIPLNLTALDEIQPVLMANGEVMWGGLGIAVRIGP